MTKKINKAQTIRELLVKNPSVNWAEVQAEFKKRGTTVTQAQFYQVRTAEKVCGGMKKKKRTTKKTTRQVVAAKTKAPVSSTLGTDAITFRDNLYQFMTKAQRELGKDTVNAATQSAFDQLG